ncbi:MAG: AAA family ATPase [Lachnospiraceae bacterium]
MKKYVITISRQFGSMGRSIAQKIARDLEIPFYDRDIVEETAKRMQLPVSLISDTEETAKSIYTKRQYPLGMGIPSLQDEIFMVQQNIIQDVVNKGSCIIVGRCADSILKNYENKLSVYIYAPEEQRLSNCVNHLGMEKSVAEKMMKAVDHSREKYNRKYCSEYKNEFTNKDIIINSGSFGIDGTAAIIKNVMREKGFIPY